MAPGRTMEASYTPFYAYASDEAGDSYGYNAFFHMLKHDRGPDGAYTHIIPFYFYSKDPDDNGFMFIFPCFWSRKNGGYEHTFFLLTGSKKQDNRKDFYPLFPLLQHTSFEGDPQRWEYFFFPFFDLSRDGSRHHLKVVDLSAILGVFQLLDWQWGIPGSEPEETGASFSFFNVLRMLTLVSGGDPGDYNDFQLITLFSSERLSLFQYHWTKRGEPMGRTVLFPLYWHLKDEEDESYHFWPLYGWDAGKDGSFSHHLLYPFFEYEQDVAEQSWTADFPWPLARLKRDGFGNHENRFLPLFWEWKEEEERFVMVLPAYASYEDGEGYQRDFYTPLFSTYEDQQEQEKGVDLLFPFISYQRSPDRFHHRLLPLYYMTFEEKAHLVECTPLFWSYHNEEGYAFDLLFPLYAHFGLGEKDDTYSFLPIFKLFPWGRPDVERPGRFQVDFLWPFVMYRDIADHTKTRLFPLFSHESRRDSVEWGFIADMFGFKREGSENTLTLFWFIPISWGGGAQ